MGLIVVDIELCKGCALCLAACAKHILEISEKSNTRGYRYVELRDASPCSGCKLCAIMCPDAAIEVYK